MDVAEWIALVVGIIAIVSNLMICAYYFGDIRRGVKSLVERGDRQDQRLDTVDVRLNDHTGRIGRIEGRLEIQPE